MENLALSAHLHLTLPIFMNLSLTYRPINKPAEMPALKFPCGALLLYLLGAGLNGPTGFALLWRVPLGQQEQYLPFYMRWNIPPALLKTLYSLE